MKYQFLQHLKIKNKVLLLTDDLSLIKKRLDKMNITQKETSYIGGFPIFKDNNGKTYSVQGLSERLNIVCSLDKQDVEYLLS